MASTTHPLKIGRGKHALFEIMAVSATAVGAALGAILAWPFGLVVGGFIGLVGGLIVGKGLEDIGTQDAAHARTVDNAIGVTNGDLGAQEIASARLSRPGDGEDESPGVLLHRDHARLDSLLSQLVLSVERGTWQDARVRWVGFEHRLRTHFATEESVLFPHLRQVKSEEVDALLEEHAQLRALVAELGIGVRERHVRSELGHELGERLHDHCAREARLAYPTADSRLSSSDVVDIEMSLDT